MKFERLTKVKDSLLNALFPDNFKCIFCDCDVPYGDICAHCEDNGIFNNKNRCKICDSPLKESNTICDHCKDKHKERHFENLYCPFIYDKEVRKSILRFKSDGAVYLAKHYAKYISYYLDEKQVEFDVIVPVPSHKSSIRKRGYNPALVLAQELSKITGKPYEEVFYKTRKTKNQKNLDYTKRQDNLNNSIILLNKSAVNGKNVLIIDDIITTGATIEACAKLIHKAKNVAGCAVARRSLK